MKLWRRLPGFKKKYDETTPLTNEEAEKVNALVTIAPLLIFIGLIMQELVPTLELEIKRLYRLARVVLFSSLIIFVIAIIVGELAGLWGILPLALFMAGIFYCRNLIRRAQRLEFAEAEQTTQD